MSNITMSIDDDLLKKSRKYAAKHYTSLNALVRQLITKAVKSGSQEWLDECFSLMDQSSGNSEGKKWKRNDLYVR